MYCVDVGSDASLFGSFSWVCMFCVFLCSTDCRVVCLFCLILRCFDKSFCMRLLRFWSFFCLCWCLRMQGTTGKGNLPDEASIIIYSNICVFCLFRQRPRRKRFLPKKFWWSGGWIWARRGQGNAQITELGGKVTENSSTFKFSICICSASIFCLLTS